MKKVIILCLISIFLSACATEPKIKGFQKQTFPAKTITLTGQSKNITPGRKLRIYIDGNATTSGLFTKKAKIKNPVGAQLAQKDKSPSVLYLNRPCYFVEDEKCVPAVWENGRYLPEVIDEMTIAIEKLYLKYSLTGLEIVGYDGGGAVALLVANRLNKNVRVEKVITIAGILNTYQQATLEDEQLLEASLNPVKEVFSLANVPQLHIVGQKDKVVPSFLTERYAKSVPHPISMQVKSYESADHINWAQFKMDY